MTDRINRILCGDVREKLQELAEGSVQCVVTSPPYWGLRDYGTEPQVWDGDPACGHEWAVGRKAGISGGTNSKMVQRKGKDNFQIVADSEYAFCQKCHAWRGSLGQEPTVEMFVEHIVTVFREVHRVLRDDGTLWLNMGDCYATSPPGNRPNTTKDVSGLPNSRENLEMRRAAQAYTKDYGHLKSKDLVGMPWRVAFALQADGWWLRSDIVWHKLNPMPESCRDRPTTSHEYVFLMTKRGRYFFDQEAVREPGSRNSHGGGVAGMHRKHRHTSGGGHTGLDSTKPAGQAGRNVRSVWTIPTQPFPEAHFATFPEELPARCIKAGTSEKGCCPVCGAPWVRVLGEARRVEGRGSGNKRRKLRHERGGLDDHFGSSVPWSPTVADTVGWQPSCDCDAGGPVPCTVLDPFVGSGTTAIVAKRLGRTAIGIELSKPYAIMARQQLSITRLGDARRPKKVKVQRKRLRVRRVRGTKGINGK